MIRKNEAFQLSILIILVYAAHGNWIKQMENEKLFEGDIVLDPAQREQLEKGTFTFASVKYKLWPNGVVPYTIAGKLTWEAKAMREINEAIRQYEHHTCLQFKKRTNERGYIEFYDNGGGCSSPVGYQGRRNGISLSSGCWWRATIMHEIGHSLGFFHEQSRPDRDSYVKILYENINTRFAYNFKKQNQSDIDSKGTPYDYRSMMHYRWNAFAIDSKMTIQTLDPTMQHEIGQDSGFSDIDIKQINLLYNCRGTYPTLAPYVPPPKGCVETGPSCHQDKYEGLCTKKYYVSYMRKNCPRVCGYCDETGTTKASNPHPSSTPTTTTTSTTTTSSNRGTTRKVLCSDVAVNCKQVGLHRCRNKSWIDFMKIKCKKSCKFC